MIDETLGRVVAGEHLTMGQMTDILGAIMRGEVAEPQIGLFLTALRAKGETTEEVAGAASVLRQFMTPIRTTRGGVLDTCGTGGDRSGTFNISTAAAIVTAAAGVPVAKHSNRGISSRSGSADVLAALGVNIDAPVGTVEACLDEVGICFCFAQRLHPSMQRVAEVRRRLGVPTIFNLIGPLCNPASASFQVLGAGRRDTARLLASALGLLGTRRSIIVTGSDGLDEVTLSGPTHVIEVESAPAAEAPGGFASTTAEGATAADAAAAGSLGLVQRRELAWTPADFGLDLRDLAEIRVTGPEQSAAMIRDVLNGIQGTARDIVLANAAAALWLTGRATTLAEATRLAADCVDSGAAADILARLAKASHSDTGH